MKPIFLFLTAISLLIVSCTKQKEQTINLAGDWQFRIDPEDIGISEKWYNTAFDETVKLPGSMVENGKGFDINLHTQWTGGVAKKEWYLDPAYKPYIDTSNIKFPFWLQPDKKYTGAAWYSKTVNITENLKNKTVWLNLERPHWESTVWINGKKAGTLNSLATAHKYNVTKLLKQGENRITVCIDNRIKDVDVGWNSHSITDHTQSNWNGIVGDISLHFTGNIYFDNIQVFPDVNTKSVKIRATIINSTGKDEEIKIEAGAELINSGSKTKEKTFGFTLSPGGNIVKMNYNIGKDALLWNEFNPNVYRLLLKMSYKNGTDNITTDFGLRDFKIKNRRFTINGKPLFLRGTLDCAIFPETGYPPTNVKDWEKEFTAIKAHGLNHVRFHSWCPPEAAFEAADKMGIYLQVECSSWANQSTRLGSGLPVDKYIWDESKRIVKSYGNHPSFVMLAYGNEPGGPDYKKFLIDFVSWWKEHDNRRVYTGGAGWPVLEINDFNVIPKPRIQRWGEGIKSIINAEPPKTDYDWSDRIETFKAPVVSHEIGQWCVYPDFKEIKRYTGPLKAKNFEIFRASLTANNMAQLADSFLLASGKLQVLCYKAEIEAALRTPGCFAGFQLLSLQDFPGQGTALVGILNPFWEEKGYVTPKEFRRFCNTVVPLARLPKRVFTEGETMTAGIEISNFAQFPLKNTDTKWKLTDGKTTVTKKTFKTGEIPVGNAIALGTAVYKFKKINKPRKLTLEVSAGNYSNSWDIWVYPENKAVETGSIKVVEKLTPSTIKFLNNGGKVLLSLGKGKVAPEKGGNIGVGFSTIFWNTAWTGGQKPHTLGILCNPAHPALKLFPSEYHSNWQWWDAMSHSDAIILNDFPAELKPIVRIIDDWVTNRRLALLFEAKIGKGKILISGADLVNNLQNRPEARQLKTSLLNYMKSDDFDPKVKLTAAQITGIIK